MYHGLFVEVGGQFVGISSLLSPCEFQNGTRVVEPGSNPPYPLSHLRNPQIRVLQLKLPFIL